MDQHISNDVYRELFEKSPRPIWVYDSETLVFLAVNEAAVRDYGYSKDAFLKMKLTDICAGANGVDLAKHGGSDHTRECDHRKKDGTVFPVEMVCHEMTFGGRRTVLALSTDILRHKRAEKQLESFSNMGRRLSAARSEQEAARILLETANELLSWDGCGFDLVREDEKQVVTILSIDTVDGRLMDRTQQCADRAPTPSTLKAIKSGAQRVVEGSTSNRHSVLSTSLYAPVRNNEKVLGVMSVRRQSPKGYSEEDLHTLQALADHCAGALERIQVEQDGVRLNEELEKRVSERTAQLESINKELETFSYSVSHDLRAPLRSIRGFSEVLLDRYSPQLDERGKEFLRRTCESSHHMDALIEDLLKLSRVNRSELIRQTVDLSTMVEALTADLRKTEPERSVEFIVAPGLKAVGDERLLRVALDNLVRNAWKFTGKSNNARIEFGFCPEPEPAFFVRDNGAGFDMEYAGKLFGVFQRLHSTGEFPGTGVGLATVQRIINRHAGRVWATGTLNQGATFYFTLPPEKPFQS